MLRLWFPILLPRVTFLARLNYCKLVGNIVALQPVCGLEALVSDSVVLIRPPDWQLLPSWRSSWNSVKGIMSWREYIEHLQNEAYLKILRVSVMRPHTWVRSLRSLPIFSCCFASTVVILNCNSVLPSPLRMRGTCPAGSDRAAAQV
jgi:hypothetical protein